MLHSSSGHKRACKLAVLAIGPQNINTALQAAPELGYLIQVALSRLPPRVKAAVVHFAYDPTRYMSLGVSALQLPDLILSPIILFTVGH